MYTVNYYHRTTQLLMLIVFSVAFRRELLPSVEPHDKIINLGGGEEIINIGTFTVFVRK